MSLPAAPLNLLILENDREFASTVSRHLPDTMRVTTQTPADYLNGLPGAAFDVALVSSAIPDLGEMVKCLRKDQPTFPVVLLAVPGQREASRQLVRDHHMQGYLPFQPDGSPMAEAAEQILCLAMENSRLQTTVSADEQELRKGEEHFQAVMANNLEDLASLLTAEENLRHRLEIERLVSTLSTHFASVPPELLDIEIQQALELVSLFVKADSCFLIKISAPDTDREQLTLSHLWSRLYPTAEVMARVSPLVGLFRWLLPTLIRHEVVYFADNDSMPDVARALMESYQTSSVLLVPLFQGEVLVGSLGFSQMASERVWSEADILILRMVGEILVNAIARREAERALRESEQRLRTVIANAPLALFTVDTRNRLTFIDGKLIRGGWMRNVQVMGRSIQYAMGRMPGIGEDCQRALRGETFSRTVTTGFTDMVYLQAWYSPLYDRNGSIVGAIGVAADITEQQRAIEAEKEQRALNSALRDTLAALVGSLDPDAVMRSILDNVGKVVPHDGAIIMLLNGDMVRMAYQAGRHEDMPDEAKLIVSFSQYRNLRTMQDTGLPCLVADTCMDPDWVHIPDFAWVRSYLGAPIKVDNQVVGFLNLDSATPHFYNEKHIEPLRIFADQVGLALRNAQLYDEVRRHKSDLEARVAERTAALAGERARLSAILDAMGEGVLYDETPLDTPPPTMVESVVYINPAFTRITGYSLFDAVDTPQFFMSLLASGLPFEKLRAISMAALQANNLWQTEFKLRRKDGTVIDAHVTLSGVRDSENHLIGTVALIRDVSQEKALQAQRDRFIANASHELRTPLTNVKLRLYLMRRQPDLMDEHLAVLEHVTNQMHELVEDLLDVARFERGIYQLELVPVELQMLIEDVVSVQKPHAERKTITLEQRAPVQLLTIRADYSRMVQVLTNLVVNAINYTPEGGHVTVEADPDPEAPDTMAVVRVLDTGVGMAAEQLVHIFEPFFRINVGPIRGTGLGLSIARELVQLHGGHIDVESRVGVGTVFTIRLPLWKPNGSSLTLGDDWDWDDDEDSGPALPGFVLPYPRS